jgi:hypothetical protein
MAAGVDPASAAMIFFQRLTNKPLEKFNLTNGGEWLIVYNVS